MNCVSGVVQQPCLLPLSSLGTAHHLNVDDLWWHIWGPACTSVPHHYRPLSLLILVSLLNISTDFQWRASASQFYGHSLRWDILGEHISYCYYPSMLLFLIYDGTFGDSCYLYFINEPVFWQPLAFLSIVWEGPTWNLPQSGNIHQTALQEPAPCFLWTCFVHMAKWKCSSH